MASIDTQPKKNNCIKTEMGMILIYIVKTKT